MTCVDDKTCSNRQAPFRPTMNGLLDADLDGRAEKGIEFPIKSAIHESEAVCGRNDALFCNAENVSMAHLNTG